MYKLIAIIVLAFTSLSGCIAYEAWNACETMRQGELRFDFPAEEIHREIKITHEVTPEMRCYSLSNYGDASDHKAWAECMGVAYK